MVEEVARCLTTTINTKIKPRIAFSVLTLLVEHQEEQLACKELSDEVGLLALLSIWRKMQMIYIYIHLYFTKEAAISSKKNTYNKCNKNINTYLTSRT